MGWLFSTVGNCVGKINKDSPHWGELIIGRVTMSELKSWDAWIWSALTYRHMVAGTTSQVCCINEHAPTYLLSQELTKSRRPWYWKFISLKPAKQVSSAWPPPTGRSSNNQRAVMLLQCSWLDSQVKLCEPL